MDIAFSTRGPTFSCTKGPQSVTWGSEIKGYRLQRDPLRKKGTPGSPEDVNGAWDTPIRFGDPMFQGGGR